MTVVLGLVVVAVLVLIAARYGADSRTGADPTGRDAAWSDRPVRHHTPRADLRMLSALTRAWGAQVRAERVLDRHQRPWDSPARVELPYRRARLDASSPCCTVTPRW